MCLQKTLTAAVILSITIITSAQANVIWDFTETSVTPIAPNPGIAEPNPPVLTSFLTVSDADFLRGSVNYTITCAILFGMCTPSGDTDFMLNAGGRLDLPVDPFLLNLGLFHSASLHISFDAEGDLSGSIFSETDSDDLTMRISNNLASGTVGSDGSALGCSNGECSFTGFLTLATTPLPVPEPSSFVLFAAALGVFGFLARRRSPV